MNPVVMFFLQELHKIFFLLDFSERKKSWLQISLILFCFSWEHLNFWAYMDPFIYELYSFYLKQCHLNLCFWQLLLRLLNKYMDQSRRDYFDLHVFLFFYFFQFLLAPWYFLNQMLKQSFKDTLFLDIFFFQDWKVCIKIFNIFY